METKDKLILIIDDSAVNLKAAGDVLKNKFRLAMAKSGRQGLDYLEKEKPDLILLDILMPEMDGFETIKKIRENPQTKDIPVIFLTGINSADSESEGFRLGAMDFIKKPFDAEAMIYRIERILEIDHLRRDLESQVNEKTMQIENMTLQVITAISNIVDNKNAFTVGHSGRVALYSEEIAKRLGWSEERITSLHYIALLHDIGKIGIPEYIINKTTALNEEEYALNQKHTAIGGDILKDFTLIEGMSEGARYHHTRFDGVGSIDGIKGKDIPDVARIIAVADYIDIYKTEKGYRSAYSDEEIIENLKNESNGYFDPEIVNAAVQMLRDGFYVPGNKAKSDSTDDDDIVGFSGAILERVISEYTEEMKNESQKDPLTGLWNRNYIENYVTEYILNGDDNAVLIMIDIDDFKEVNDTYGHIVGDKVLMNLRDAMTSCVGNRGVIGRLGGDEFIMFITGTDSRDEIEEISKKITKYITEKNKKINQFLTNSVSMGIAMLGVDGEDFLSLYKNADKALYYVKQNNKGNYHFYSEENKQQPVCDTYWNLQEEKNKIFAFTQQYIPGSHEQGFILLFSLRKNSKKNVSVEDVEFREAFRLLHSAVCGNLRRGDIFARYSDSQYVVLLMNVDKSVALKVSERIADKYEHISGFKTVELSCSVYDIDENDI